MAKEMSYEAADGTLHDSSYWRVVSLYLSVAERRGNILFYGYKDKEARLANKTIVGQKSYPVAGDDYEAYFAATVLDTENPIAKSYELAMAVKDQAGDVSFFETAKDV